MNGFNYPLSGLRLYFYSAAIIIFGLVILSVFFTGIMKPFLKIFFKEEHIKIIDENKLQIFLISYFVFNTVLNFINNTGAFEIFYNNEIIYSKLKYCLEELNVMKLKMIWKKRKKILNR